MIQINKTLKDIIKQYGTKNKIVHLLQVDNYFGSAKKSNKRTLVAVALIFGPILLVWPLFVNLAKALGAFKAFLVAVLIYGFYSWQVIARVVLHQSDRLYDWRKARNQQYDSVGKLVNMKNIEEQYIHYPSKTAIIIECFNGSQDNKVKFELIRSFLDSLHAMSDIQYEIRVHNDTHSTVQVSQVYKNIRKMKDQDTAEQIIKMIRMNGAANTLNSRILRTMYVIYCRVDEKQFILNQLQHILPDRAYYVCRIPEYDEIKQILEYDLGVDLNLEEIVITSYSDDNFGNSSILEVYNRVEEKQEAQKQRRRL